MRGPNAGDLKLSQNGFRRDTKETGALCYRSTVHRDGVTNYRLRTCVIRPPKMVLTAILNLGL